MNHLFRITYLLAAVLMFGDCHAANGRMDWEALGYKGNPLAAKPPPRKKK